MADVGGFEADIIRSTVEFDPFVAGISDIRFCAAGVAKLFAAGCACNIALATIGFAHTFCSKNPFSPALRSASRKSIRGWAGRDGICQKSIPVREQLGEDELAVMAWKSLSISEI
jgi:hypothetical protein